MSWILSLLGLGGAAGLGLYLALVPGAAATVMSVLAGAVRIVKENPWQAGLALALAWGTYERLDAVHAYSGWRASNKKYADHIASDKQAAKEETAGSTARAQENDHVHTVLKVVYRDAIDRFIAANPCVVQPAGPATDASGSAPGVPAQPAAPTEYVAVTPADLRAFADDYTYAYSAYLAAQAKVKAGKAVYAAEDLTIPAPDLSPTH